MNYSVRGTVTENLTGSIHFMFDEMMKLYWVNPLGERVYQHVDHIYDQFTSFHPYMNNEVLKIFVPESFYDAYTDLVEQVVGLQGNIETFEEFSSFFGDLFYKCMTHPENVMYPDLSSRNDRYVEGIPLSIYLVGPIKDYEYRTCPNYYEFGGYKVRNSDRYFECETSPNISNDIIKCEIPLKRRPYTFSVRPKEG